MLLKKFILRVLVFIAIAFFILSFETVYQYFDRSYEKTVNGNEVYVSVRKSKVKKKVKILIIGDSVGKQLYDNDTYNDDVYSLACNQAISLAGQYILLENFIENNRQNLPGEIILIITPGSFTNNLNQIYSFHYFLKPFYKAEYSALITDTCRTQIHKIPFYFLSQIPSVLNTNWSPAYLPDADTSYRFISPISNNYLLKIKALCVKNHLNLKFFCPPIKLSKKKLNLNYAKNTVEIERTGFKTEFASYFKNIVFFPDSLYKDHIHFKKQYIPTDYFHLLKTE
jgi:archaellum component FlaF (FlaF/FlaG flagellin family)